MKIFVCFQTHPDFLKRDIRIPEKGTRGCLRHLQVRNCKDSGLLTSAQTSHWLCLLYMQTCWWQYCFPCLWKWVQIIPRISSHVVNTNISFWGSWGIGLEEGCWKVVKNYKSNPVCNSTVNHSAITWKRGGEKAPLIRSRTEVKKGSWWKEVKI